MSKFSVGDPCITTNPGRTPERAVVEKVGRLYLTTRMVASDGTVAGEWSRRRFHIETGAEKSEYTAGAIYTLQEWDEREDRLRLLARLRDFGVGRVGFGRCALDSATFDQLRRIVAILEEP